MEKEKFKFDDLSNNNKYGLIFKDDEDFFQILKRCHYNKVKKLIKDLDNNKCFQFGLLPQQIVGDINKAKIFLLNLNPSFDENDFNDEEELKNYLCDILKLDFSSELKEYPFLFLNPKLEKTGGYKWWNNGQHFKSYIEYLKENMNMNEEDARKKLAKIFCCIELVPYHARKLPISAKKMLECPSVKKVREYVLDKLIPQAKDKKIIIICLRSKKNWDIEKYIMDDDYSVYLSPNIWRANFSLNGFGNEVKNELIKILEGND